MKLVKDIDKTSTKNPDVTDKQAEEAFKTILTWIGENPNREGLIETPKRVVKAFKEYFKGYKMSAKEDLSKTFGDVGNYDDMVVEKNITFESHCEHHMAPIIGVAHVAYIPVGRIVGISKLARILDLHAKRLQNQERITKSVADDLERELNPLGAAVILEAAHGCMQCRGVMKQNSLMVTSAMRGVFFEKAEARAELMQLIHS